MSNTWVLCCLDTTGVASHASVEFAPGGPAADGGSADFARDGPAVAVPGVADGEAAAVGSAARADDGARRAGLGETTAVGSAARVDDIEMGADGAAAAAASSARKDGADADDGPVAVTVTAEGHDRKRPADDGAAVQPMAGSHMTSSTSWLGLPRRAAADCSDMTYFYADCPLRSWRHPLGRRGGGSST